MIKQATSTMKKQTIFLIKRTLTKRTTLLFATISIMLFSSCTEHKQFFRGDVIGFSDEVETSYTTTSRGMFMNFKPQSAPYNLLNENDVTKMKYSIDKVPRGNNTSAYYAMELAAQRVKYIRKKIARNDPKTRYYIFLLTDGLDNSSPQVAKKDGRIMFSISPEKYQKRIQRKLKHAMGLWHKNEFEVYTLMYEGDDIEEAKRMNNMTDEQYDKILRNSMECFRYSSNGEAPELISANNFDSIIEKTKEKLKQTSYTFRVAKSYAGKKIRMNFKNNEGEEVTLTATLKKSLSSYSLTDVALSNGATATIKAISGDNINALFVIEDFQLKDGHAYYPKKSATTQDYEIQPGLWQRNSEYIEKTNEMINTYFILVIDGSRSLDGKNHDKNGFEEETDLAKEIMEIMME
ncbi:MAG: hypothetical protein J6X86_04690 [Bacteroidales bacterium]|nr:hypothetical protein [Bacteroidales bacterium]